jgi:hypothetical protein
MVCVSSETVATLSNPPANEDADFGCAIARCVDVPSSHPKPASEHNRVPGPGLHYPGAAHVDCDGATVA